ncbi:MAG: hypothetical protein JWP59_3752, partial [Massilia sp.]|nr:hypothetical protein [Massilia sp.]
WDEQARKDLIEAGYLQAALVDLAGLTLKQRLSANS